MRATIEQGPVLNAITKQPYCQTGIIPFKMGGRNVTNHGQHISYFADALASANQTVDINIGSSFKNDLNITVHCPA
jgi:hypothetical protein